METNQTADRGERYFLPNYRYCLGRLTFGNEAEITRYIYFRRTNMAAWGSN
jgi:hypothetical protein